MADRAGGQLPNDLLHGGRLLTDVPSMSTMAALHNTTCVSCLLESQDISTMMSRLLYITAVRSILASEEELFS
jgi:hypothetical protein